MPPRPKTFSQPKNKKRAEVDYLSIERAAASKPKWDFDDWQEEGIKQEGQGERYISGSKAIAHYQRSITAYDISYGLRNSFDSSYNSARVRFHLATELLALPESRQLLHDSIEWYRKGLTLTTEEDENKIDALFNLAQALISNVELGKLTSEQSMDHYTEARQFFAQVEEIQVKGLELFKEMQQSPDNSSEEMEVDDAQDQQKTMDVETATIVTPPQVLDTYVEIISLDLLIYQLTSDPTVLKDIFAVTLRASQVRQLIPSSQQANQATQDLEIRLLALDVASQVPVTSSLYMDPSQIEAQYGELMNGYRNSPANLTSAYGDFLAGSFLPELVTQNPSLETLQTLWTGMGKALALYQQGASGLSSRLSPPKDVPPYSIPSMLVSNYISQVEIMLAQESFLKSFPGCTPKAGFGGGHSSSQAMETILKASQFLSPVIGALIQYSTTGLKCKWDTGKFPKTTQASHQDIKTFYTLYLTAVRVGLRLGTSLEKVERMNLGVYLWKEMVEDYEQLVRNDLVWRLSGGEEWLKTIL